jgi:predicted transcriptional regulator
MSTTKRKKSTKYAKQDTQRGTESLDFQAAPRAAQALRLRRLGYTYDEIAREVGYANESGARKAVKTANARIVRDEARALVGWQLDQLDVALSVVMEAIAKRDKSSLWAVDRLVPLLKRQADLMGLDAPKPESQAQQLTLLSVPIAADVLEAV